jgi:hypothetical protein
MLLYSIVYDNNNNDDSTSSMWSDTLGGQVLVSSIRINGGHAGT